MKYDPQNYPDEIADVLALGEKLRNWGRWGVEDERGTANLIKPEHRVHAASLVKRGDVISLALPIRIGEGPVRPYPAGRFNPVHTMTVTGDTRGPFDMGATTDFTDDIITMGLQGTTHWDGLCHVYYQDLLYNGFPASSVDRFGAHKNAIGALATDFVARGVLLDIARFKGVRTLEAGYSIRPHELLECAEKQNVTLGQGDMLLIRTGAMADVGRNNWDDFHSKPRPGIHYSTAEMIHDLGIATVSADNNAVESGSTVKGLSNPFHMVALRDMGVSLGEFWYLEDIADDCARDGVYEFMLVAQPLRVIEGAGSPVNPLAIK